MGPGSTAFDGQLRIEEATDSDLEEVLAVERAAFESDLEAELVRELLGDPTARPLLSLVARVAGRCVGHILFSSAVVIGRQDLGGVALLAPVAIVPDRQRQGIGGALIERGLDILRRRGVALVFVLGHPDYYRRHGFERAGPLGFDPPFGRQAGDAWMVQVLAPAAPDDLGGTVRCAESLMQPRYWPE